MKNVIWPLVVLVLAALFILEFRYDIVINSPIAAKIDRITGDVWIANSGMWIKVKHPVKEIEAVQPAVTVAKPVAKADSQAKSK